MRIGIPKEIKEQEFRVGLTPAGVHALVERGHEVWVERGAGARIGHSDGAYERAGARIVDGPEAVYQCPMVVKVKEPQPSEVPLLWEGQVLFTYLHLAAFPELTRQLIERGIVAIAYETVTDAKGRLPLLIPMSEVAGRLAIQAGARGLEMVNGGRGVLLGGVPGTVPGRVCIVGGGTVGTEAAKMARGLGADVTLLDINLDRLRYLDDLFGGTVKTVYADRHALDEAIEGADLVIGAVLVPGHQAPKLITRDNVRRMADGAVIVDVAIDQGGAAETSHPTTHADPFFVVDGVVHYCVANMPGAVARTATHALTNATTPFVLALADRGWREALRADPGLRAGLNLCLGKVTHPAVAEDLGYEYTDPIDCLGDRKAP